MREWQEIISREHIREHIRVARHELPWEHVSKATFYPERGMALT
jgi:hypothetical protein